jgi:fatty acid desaturase
MPDEDKKGKHVENKPEVQGIGEREYMFWITIALVAVTFVITIYGMHIGWSTTEILALLAFFGPLLTAAITHYFLGKSAEKEEKAKAASDT